MNKVRVLIVDDSAFIRVLLTEILQSSEHIEVVATAIDPIDAREKIKKYSPDVLTLDVEMPKMDGITFLKNLMRLRPMPVVMVSTLTQAGADTTIEALEVGAFDFVGKPSTDVKGKLTELSSELIGKVIAASKCNTTALEKNQSKQREIHKVTNATGQFDLIAIGASTGGTEAIRELITTLPANLPPIVMAQHIPPSFSSSFAKRLNLQTEIKVQEVLATTKLQNGHAYLAPGGAHMKIKREGGGYWATIDHGEKVNRHRPSVDVLYDSIVQLKPAKCLAIILTGMGKDGANGLKRLSDLGAKTVAQDEESSVVWGMPGSAVAIGGAKHVIPLKGISKFIVQNQ